MNKAQLIESLADRLGGKKAATEAVDAVLETIQRTVKDGIPVAISGFGVFEKVTVPARRHRNPRTGEPVRTKKTTRPKFRPGQGFKDVVNGTRKLPKVTAAATATATNSTVSATRSVTGAAGRSTGTANGRRAATKTALPTGSASTRAKKAPASGAGKATAGTDSALRSAKPVTKAAKATKATATKARTTLTKTPASAAKKSSPAKRTAKRTANA